MASKKNKVIERVDKENKILSMDEKMKEQYWYEQKALYAENTMKSVAKKEGREEGEKNTRNAIIKKLLKKGIKEEDIVEITGLSIEEIEKIK